MSASLSWTRENLTLDFTSRELGMEGQDSYSVLRGDFDQWLMGICEDAGCDIIPGIAVEELLKDEAGNVIGIRAGEDDITAYVTIIAEGCNSLLTERGLGARRPKPNEMAVGHQGGLPAPGRDHRVPLPVQGR